MIKRIKNKHLLSSKTNDVSKNPIRVLYKKVGQPSEVKIISDVYKFYYLAMKIVPLLERKVLYLSYIENCRLNDICKKLKLGKNEVISLRSKAINHFKHNLEILYKSEKLKKGSKNDKKN